MTVSDQLGASPALIRVANEKEPQDVDMEAKIKSTSPKRAESVVTITGNVCPTDLPTLPPIYILY